MKKLKKVLHAEEQRYEAHSETEKDAEPVEILSDDALFSKAMRDVRTIESKEPQVAITPHLETKKADEPIPPRSTVPTPRFRVREKGQNIEAAIVDLGPRVRRKLRRGAYPVEARLDLHGHDARTARNLVGSFIVDSIENDCQCVLIVHGKGKHSPGAQPVLKAGLQAWLTEIPLCSLVLAYTSAQPADGGTGAIYVLLRKSR